MSFLSYPTTDEQKALLAITGELADTFAKRALEYDWIGHFPRENFTDLYKAGYLTLSIPRAAGGRGASIEDLGSCPVSSSSGRCINCARCWYALDAHCASGGGLSRASSGDYATMSRCDREWSNDQ